MRCALLAIGWVLEPETIWLPRCARFSRRRYPSRLTTKQDVARLVVDEAYHNERRLPGAALHNEKGTGIARDPIVPTRLSGDIALLKQAMVALVPQWLGGWDAASDPLCGL